MKTLFFNHQTRQISFQTSDGIFYIPKATTNDHTDTFSFECILGVVEVTKNSKYLFFCSESESLGHFDSNKEKNRNGVDEMNKYLNKAINKEANKDLNKYLNKGINEQSNKDLNKDLNKEMNNEINECMKDIFAIRKVEYVPITIEEAEDAAETIKDLIESLDFYYTFDKIENHFLWNDEMIRKFNDLNGECQLINETSSSSSNKNNRNPFSKKYRTNKVQEPIVPNMFCGYFETQKLKTKEMIYTLKIMSKISTRKIGPRMLSRGVDELGNVSFFVETQFLVEEGSNKSLFRILRGSVPLYWSQSDPLRPHKINFDKNSEENSDAFKKHMEKLEGEYGKIVVVNLLGGRKYEKILCKMYGDQCQKESINYIHFDLNKHAENIKNIKNAFYRHLSKCMEEIQQGKTVFLDEHSNPVLGSSSQSDEELSNEWEEEIQTETEEPERSFDSNGITFRVNCVDCLDRTNIGQHLIFNFFDEYKFGISKRMWVNNGNALSKMYTGSDTLKNELSYKGKLSVLGKMNDLMISANRMINNKFTDRDKQTTIDTILGKSTFDQ